ncbi:4-hydroxy-3-methylbut-2-en-1-yl diphosphate synthase [Candidatus Termititenax persephonae]|uniref:4-hydroxy-3-methylbut-2-en-1-yl diphosphate synthase (flavodoxin) n=1 Tax=Candidatus Termititenax persephonae TaxID=2218525 RepID=A0A388THA4_9BACT|nr:4-hydroxy-3-methylbut-2-en-1-yl diphosphate synthase [Candidatus Termititenax persephonae]
MPPQIKRLPTRVVSIGPVKIGGSNPIAVQSMTNTFTTDVRATVRQIKACADAGCAIIRVAVPDQKALAAFAAIKKLSPLPVVADIHFDYRLAVGAIEAGADKIRINPGNLQGAAKLKEIIAAAKKRHVPIRIGVNSGSAKKDLVRLASEYCEFFEAQKFYNLVLSLKSSSVVDSLDAYTRMARRRDYPLHIGITEAGTEYYGALKSAVGLGALLTRGLGDTVRVSLTANPVKEVLAARHILKSLGLLACPEVISCPTCGRTQIDIIGLANTVEQRLQKLNKNLTVAVMGCVVNGPGEAAQADYGIAGGRGQGIIFAKGRRLKTVPERKLVEELFKLIERSSRFS